MTKTSYKRLENKDDVSIEKRNIMIKGKGLMQTYILKQLEFQDTEDCQSPLITEESASSTGSPLFVRD